MIHYKDMTFCPFFGDCKNADGCHRPLTAEVVIGAEKMGLPISQFAEKPNCHEETEAKNNEHEE